MATVDKIAQDLTKLTHNDRQSLANLLSQNALDGSEPFMTALRDADGKDNFARIAQDAVHLKARDKALLKGEIDKFAVPSIKASIDKLSAKDQELVSDLLGGKKETVIRGRGTTTTGPDGAVIIESPANVERVVDIAKTDSAGFKLAVRHADNREAVTDVLRRTSGLAKNQRETVAGHLNTLASGNKTAQEIAAEEAAAVKVAAEPVVEPVATAQPAAAAAKPDAPAPEVKAKTTAPSDKDLKQAEKFFEDNKSMKVEEFTKQLAKAEKFNGFQKALGSHAGKIGLAGAAVAAASSLLPNQTSTNEDGTPGDEKWGAGKKALVFAGGTAAVAGAIAKPTWGKTLHIAEMEKVLKAAGKSATTIIGHAV